jgi:hypothetical protein
MPVVLVRAPSISYAQIATSITTQQQQQQQRSAPFLPEPQTTFPPSVFPPTQSFLPPTSFAVPTGSLSPWFPSVPAIACGGTFYLTITGDTYFKHVGSKHSNVNYNGYKNNDNNASDYRSSNGKQTIALQVIAPGGIDLDQNSVTGKVFVGQDNIDKNKAQKLNIDSLTNNCKSSTFQDSNDSDPVATSTPVPIETSDSNTDNTDSTATKTTTKAVTSSIAPSAITSGTTTSNISTP